MAAFRNGGVEKMIFLVGKVVFDTLEVGNDLSHGCLLGLVPLMGDGLALFVEWVLWVVVVEAP